MIILIICLFCFYQVYTSHCIVKFLIICLCILLKKNKKIKNHIKSVLTLLIFPGSQLNILHISKLSKSILQVFLSDSVTQPTNVKSLHHFNTYDSIFRRKKKTRGRFSDVCLYTILPKLNRFNHSFTVAKLNKL